MVTHVSVHTTMQNSALCCCVGRPKTNCCALKLFALCDHQNLAVVMKAATERMKQECEKELIAKRQQQIAGTASDTNDNGVEAHLPTDFTAADVAAVVTRIGPELAALREQLRSGELMHPAIIEAYLHILKVFLPFLCPCLFSPAGQLLGNLVEN